MKQIILSLLCLVALTASAEVVGGVCGESAKWSINTETGKLSITGSGAVEFIEFDTLYYDYVNPWEAYKKNISSIEISNGITSICSYAFSDCTQLTSVEIPNTVDSLGDGVFSRNTMLMNLIIPNTVQTVGNYLVSGCTNLERITINIVSWSNNNLLTYLYPLDVDKYTYLYKGKKVEGELIIPSDVTVIGNDVLSKCEDVTSVVLPNTITTIGTGAFFRCTNMTNINIPTSISIIDGGVFNGCSGLKDVVIPSNVTKINDYAFYECTGMETLEIPSSVTEINYRAFYNCSGLKSIKVGWVRPLSIGSVFNGVDKKNCTLYVPKGSWSLYCSAPVWMDFVNIEEYDPSTPPTPELEGDVNHDGVVDVADITRVAQIILGIK